MKHSYNIIVFVLSLFVCTSAFSDDSAISINRSNALAQAMLATQETYPNAEQVIVDSLQNISYNADGTYVQTDEQYIKIMTEEARRAHQTISSYFTIPYQRGPEDCRIDLLEIIKPSGQSIKIDVNEQSRVMTNPGSMSQNIYNPNDQLIQVNISGLEVGDILHYVMYDRIVQPRMTNTWGDWVVFESTSPIMRKTIIVEAPTNRPLQSMALKAPVSNTVTQIITTNTAGIRYQWTATNVPRMFPEPNMPHAHTVVQRQLISTVPDWETISRWYWYLSEPHLSVTPAIEEKVSELVTGAENDQQKIENIFQFVSQQIRYMGITVEATAPGYEPHDVSDTFSAQHGVCRDKAALLVAMLRTAGFDAYPTLIHNGPKKDTEVPLPYFNHAIVAVRNPDGSFQLMDPTDENTRQLLPAYLNDKSYLVATPEGETLQTSSIIPAEQNMMHIKTVAALSSNNSFTATTTLLFDGINDNAYRGAFARLKPEDRTRFLSGIIKRSLPEAVIDNIKIQPSDMTDISKPLSISITYQADDVLVNGQTSSLLPLPILGTSVGMANFILGQTGLEERKYPLMTETACGVSEQITLEIAPELGQLEVVPQYEDVLHESISWATDILYTNDTLSIALNFSLLKTEYTPQEYSDLKETLKTTERDIRKKPILCRQQIDSTQPDSRILSVLAEYEVINPQCWRQTRTVKRKILSYAGKKKNSEIKFHYNPSMETVKLNYAHVTSTNGTMAEISEKEINIMDAAWAGSAPRYPAGKTLIASLPAVSIGSIIEFQVETIHSNTPFFSAHEMFRFMEPLDKKSVRINLPENLTPALAYIQAEDVLIQEQQEHSTNGSLTHIIEWSITNSAPVIREDMLPPWYTFNPSAFISLGRWDTYAIKINTLLLNATMQQPATEQKTGELIAHLNDPLEKLRAIRDYIAINIRTAGPGIDSLPLSCITPADQTLSDGYGNTTDKAVLYYTMLKHADFDPAFVLAGSDPCLAEINNAYMRSPDASFFSSVLVRLTNGLPDISEGTAYYLNAGTQYSEPGSCAYENNTMLTLPNGSFEEIKPAKQSKTVWHYLLTPQTNGTTELSIHEQLYGTGFASANQRFAEMPPEERRRYHQELIGSISQAAKPVGPLHTDFSNYPGTIEYAVTIPDYAVATENYLYFDLPCSLNNIFRLRTDKRNNPYYLSHANQTSFRVDVNLPTSYLVESHPESLKRTNIADTGSSIFQEGQLTVNEQHSVYIMHFDADLVPGIIPATDYDELLYLNKRLSKTQNSMILLKKNP